MVTKVIFYKSAVLQLLASCMEIPPPALRLNFNVRVVTMLASYNNVASPGITELTVDISIMMRESQPHDSCLASSPLPQQDSRQFKSSGGSAP